MPRTSHIEPSLVSDRIDPMLRKIAGPFREFGFVAGTLYVIDRLLRGVSPGLGLFVYEFMVQPISDKPLLPANLARGLVFREIRRGDPKIALMPARPEIKESRFDQGAVCLGGFKNDRLIGYIWFCFDTYEEDEVRCTYQLVSPAESVFDFDLFVFPEHRMGIGFMAVWDGANRFLRDRGVLYSFSRLTRFNLASRRAHQHLGWKRLASAIFLKIWNVELMLATVFPFVSLSFGPSRRVRLLFRPDVLQSTEKRN
jgi:hypothetical protein